MTLVRFAIEEAEKDLDFIDEIIERLEKSRDRGDPTEFGYALEMLSDWRAEIRQTLGSMRQVERRHKQSDQVREKLPIRSNTRKKK